MPVGLMGLHLLVLQHREPELQIICLVGIEFQCPISAERSTIGHQNLKMTQIRDLAVDQVCHRGA